MSSLYYNCSPYRKKGFVKKPKLRHFGRGLMMHSGGRWAFFGKRNLVHDIARTVKDGSETFQEAIRVAKNIKSGKFRYEIGPTALVFCLVFTAVSLSLIYLAHFNSVATKGYELRRLEADRQQLMTQYDIKNMKLAEAKALATISQSEKALAMRAPAAVEFIKGTTALASR